jgi:hypothetical protein
LVEAVESGDGLSMSGPTGLPVRLPKLRQLLQRQQRGDGEARSASGLFLVLLREQGGSG